MKVTYARAQELCQQVGEARQVEDQGLFGSLLDLHHIESRLADRREARAAKDFVRSDAIRDELAAAGVDVMDGDPLGWDWKPNL